MFDLRQTEVFARWFAALRDGIARKRVARRLALLQAGHVGDARSVGGKVSELRIDHGPGYRLYLTRRGATVIVLLAGGNKSSQARDIAVAKQLAEP